MSQSNEQSVIATGMLVGCIFALGIAVGTAVEKRERERRQMLKRLDKLDPPPALPMPRFVGALSLSDLAAAAEREDDLAKVRDNGDR